jgi:hypothetical protein
LRLISENGIIEKDPFATLCAYAKFQQKITFQTITLFLVDDLKAMSPLALTTMIKALLTSIAHEFTMLFISLALSTMKHPKAGKGGKGKL